jgi:hypothetical protein
MTTGSPNTPRDAILAVLRGDCSHVAMTAEWEGSDEESLSALERYSPLSSRGKLIVTVVVFLVIFVSGHPFG